jgi:hypothetical protein
MYGAVYGFRSAIDRGRLYRGVEQKLLLGNVLYWHPPLLIVEAANPSFQPEVLGKHVGAGGVRWAALLNADGMVTPNP